MYIYIILSTRQTSRATHFLNLLHFYFKIALRKFPKLFFAQKQDMPKPHGSRHIGKLARFHDNCRIWTISDHSTVLHKATTYKIF